MFPPGRARLATNPLPTGSISVAALAERVVLAPAVTIYLEAHRFDGKRPDTIAVALTRSVLNNNVLPLHVPKLA
jgi:hypothetical protein